MIDHETFVAEVLGNHVVVARINSGFEGEDDLVCRHGDFWFVIDAASLSHWEPLTPTEASEMIARFAI